MIVMTSLQGSALTCSQITLNTLGEIIFPVNGHPTTLNVSHFPAIIPQSIQIILVVKLDNLPYAFPLSKPPFLSPF